MRLCGSMLLSNTETCRSDIYVYFNVNFNVFFKIKKCICWWMNCTYIRMHGATIKKDKILQDIVIQLLTQHKTCDWCSHETTGTQQKTMSNIKFAFRNPAHYHGCQWCKETHHDGLALYTTYQQYSLCLTHTVYFYTSCNANELTRDNTRLNSCHNSVHFVNEIFYKKMTCTYI